jgi:hypothetical protein
MQLVSPRNKAETGASGAPERAAIRGQGAYSEKRSPHPDKKTPQQDVGMGLGWRATTSLGTARRETDAPRERDANNR